MDSLTTGNVRQSTAVPRLSSSNESAAFGDFLRHARERRGLTLQQISRETKIPFRHLNALEHGELAAVPEGIYRRAQIKAFAKTVGLDQNVALAELERALEASKPQRQPAGSTSGSSLTHKNRVLVVAGLIALSSLAVSALTFWSRGTVSPVDVQPLSRIAPEVAAAPADVPVERASAETAPKVEVAPAIATQEIVTTSPPAPDEAPVVSSTFQSGQLTIVTEPAGARVTINGMGRGTTPLTLENVPLGTHRIRVTLDGFVGQERTAQLGPTAATASVKISLQPVP